jgi:ribosome-associated toxin RatA of RatAB toxin-antitoxin module
MVWTWVAFFLFLSPLRGASGAPVDYQVLEPTPNRFDVSLRARIPAPLPAVWHVLTDYDHHADFLPYMRKSQCLREENGHKIVYQEGGLRILFWSFLIRVKQRVQEHPPSEMDFESIEGTFKTLKGEWYLRPSAVVPGPTQLDCHFVVEPKSRVPRWAVRFTTRHYLARMVRSLQKQAEQQP